MAVMAGHEPITEFSQWYNTYGEDPRNPGCLEFKAVTGKGQLLWYMWEKFKREMDSRVADYETLEKLADGQVINPKPDLPNISSGETAGIVRRIARNLVQNTPNVEVISLFDDDSAEGIFSRYVLVSKIIGSDQYSNDMQQNLFASTKTALTLGFDTVIPCLLQNPGGTWFIKYDAIHYRDVFPEPGVKDVRDSSTVFIRRYLTKGDVKKLIRTEAVGWDCMALKKLLLNPPPGRERHSVDFQTKKRKQVPDGYEVITWYSDTGEAFLTFDASTKMLLRIEKNKHPLKEHPVHFLILEKDSQQPFGKSQVELLVGRQDFQDLMLNGAMKLWYRNINPSIIAYGASNATPNLGPGKYTQIANPNARLEAFEVNTQTLMQYGSISEGNLGSMVNLLGSADQQMATQAGNGMSATPQGVEAQAAMVDITTNNYQKAIEGFFSHYCSYALTIFFQELRGVTSVTPTADARIQLIQAGMDSDKLDKDGNLEIDFQKLATEYWVRCVPGSLVEMEDEKQLRILNQLFVPLSQAMPAMAATQDTEMMQQAASAMQYIITKQIELSGSAHAGSIAQIFDKGNEEGVEDRDQRIEAIESTVGDLGLQNEEEMTLTNQALIQLQQNQTQIVEALGLVLNHLGMSGTQSELPASSSEPT